MRFVLLIICVVLVDALRLAMAADPQFELRVVDQDSNEPIAVRMHVFDRRQQPVTVAETLNQDGFFTIDGAHIFRLKPGEYTFRMERGPEYKIRTGNFSIQKAAEDNQQVTMERFAHLSHDGWYSGDLDSYLADEDIGRWMLAEDLHFAVTTAKENQKADTSDSQAVAKQRFFSSQAVNISVGRRQQIRLLRTTAALEGKVGPDSVFEHLKRIYRSHPDAKPIVYLGRSFAANRAAADDRSHTHPDLPVWLASGQLKMFPVLDQSFTHQANWHVDDLLAARETYFKILEAGCRIPPVAGSGAGISGNPLGYNRVYVYCGEEFTADRWWSQLLLGRCFITNGPILTVKANDQLPGTVFPGYQGETVTLELSANLATREKISYLQVIKNGQNVAEVRLDDWAKAGGRLPPIEFTESGWCLLMAQTENADTPHLAMSGPFYVEFDNQVRVSPDAIRWLHHAAQLRLKQLQQQGDSPASLRYHQAAVRKFAEEP
ncbi:MAG: hypothetical protein KDA87_01660 [Planctomycetales bacterium]|nr:hypothetical protein [Planctomycetales bacterium]